MQELRLLTLDPGHFHAALVQKEMYPGISRQVSVFAPLGADLVEHLARIVRFNTRAERPTAWEESVYAAPDYLDCLMANPPGDVVILSGRNRTKIDYISRSIEAGLYVLADKPWIIRSNDLDQLSATLDQADDASLVAYDIMTERYEVTSILQRELVNDPEVFGAIVPGTAEAPGVSMKSVHHIMKLVAGVALRRPAWFFDIAEQGEGLSDVGTHLIDLVQWTLFPKQAINYRTEIEIHAAKRWPTVLSLTDFERVTGEPDFPPFLAGCVRDGKLDYYCNNQVSYSLRGVRVKLDVLWDYEAPAGAGDTHFASYRGSRSRVEVRQGPAESYRPELYVVPAQGQRIEPVEAAVRARMETLQKRYRGIQVERHRGELRIDIPERIRVGHESHFAQVCTQFLDYIRGDSPVPACEKPNMLAKYYVSTRGVELAR